MGNLAKSYLLQLCQHGFFNTDPHPGNLAVDSGVPGGRIIFYDFGQATELEPQQSKGILDVIGAIIDLDAPACVDAFQAIGVLKEGADRAALLDVVSKNFASGRIKSKASQKKQKKDGEAGSPEGPTSTVETVHAESNNELVTEAAAARA